MNAQLRLDIARELLRLASPAQRGLRRMVLNTRTGRRTYWVQIPKPKPRAIEKREENLTAKQLKLTIEDLSVPEDFSVEGLTKTGVPVSVACRNGGEISFQVGDTYQSGAVTGADAIGATKLMVKLMKKGMESHPKGTVYRCIPYDSDEKKRESKKRFYQKNGFGEAISDELFAIKGDKNLHPVDYSYLKEIKEDVEGVVVGFKNNRDETERIMNEIEQENDDLNSEINGYFQERAQLRFEIERTEDDDEREEMEDQLNYLEDLIVDRRERLSQNEDRLLDVAGYETPNIENIFKIHSLLKDHDF